MADQISELEEQQVCKHHQKGYYKHGNPCHQYHRSMICKEKVCKDMKTGTQELANILQEITHANGEIGVPMHIV